MAARATRTSPSVLVRCADCGDAFELAVRNERQHRRTGKPHRCSLCRSVEKWPTPTEADLRWWTDTVGLDEAKAIAGMIWSPAETDI